MSTNTERAPWETPASQAPQLPDFGGPVVRGGPADSMTQRREQAIKRIKAKNDFKTHLVVYVAVKAMLVVIWAFTNGGFFWPIFPIVGWVSGW